MLTKEEEVMNSIGFSVFADISEEEIHKCNTVDELLQLFYYNGAYIEHKFKEVS